MDDAPKRKKRRKGGEPKGMTVGDYDVGKGKPPKHTRWQKGCASPNPKGRPPKPKPGTRDLEYFLNERVTMAGPNGPETFTKRELGYLQLSNLVAKCTPWAIKLVGTSEKNGSEIEDPLLFNEELTRQIIEDATRERDKPEDKGWHKDNPE